MVILPFHSESANHEYQPLTFQVQTCSNTAKGILFRVGREENTPMEDNEKSFADLYSRIDATVKILRAAKKEKFSAPVGPSTLVIDAC